MNWASLACEAGVGEGGTWIFQTVAILGNTLLCGTRYGSLVCIKLEIERVDNDPDVMLVDRAPDSVSFGRDIKSYKISHGPVHVV